MAGQRREIETQLKELPESFTADQIKSMCEALEQDVEKLQKTGMPREKAESLLHHKHKTLAFSYPTMFFKIVRGEMDKHIFETLLKIKERMESGEVNDEKAKELVIDGAKRHVEGAAPRLPPRRNTEGSEVHEITMKCRADEEEYHTS